MADLATEHKTFIVRCLARFLSPTEIVEAVKEEFDGLAVSKQQVRHYNPEQSAEVAAEWRALFETERQTVIAETNGIGISHKSVRLRELDAMFRKAKSMKNYGLCADLLQQAAKEQGGVFSNKIEHVGANDGPIQVLAVDYRAAIAPLAPDDSDPG